MITSSFRGAVFAVALVTATGAFAQEPPPGTADEPEHTPTIEELQRQVDELTRQLAVVQGQLEEMQTRQEEERRQAEVEQLRQTAAAEAATATAPDEVDTTTKYVSGTRMQPQLNPEISVTGDLFFSGGENEKEEM
ncbi:MAG: hypothetical protein PVG53_14835, partial [Holophagae bacterium]